MAAEFLLEYRGRALLVQITGVDEQAEVRIHHSYSLVPAAIEVPLMGLPALRGYTRDAKCPGCAGDL